jgi:hypothetical protein
LRLAFERVKGRHHIGIQSVIETNSKVRRHNAQVRDTLKHVTDMMQPKQMKQNGGDALLNSVMHSSNALRHSLQFLLDRINVTRMTQQLAVILHYLSPQGLLDVRHCNTQTLEQ